MSSATSIITITMALLLVRESYRRAKDGFPPAYLILLCSITYIALELEWVLTGQAGEIGSIRNTAWTMVEFGLMLGFWACSRRARRCKEWGDV